MNVKLKKKLTPTQQAAVDLMSNGWELGASVELHANGRTRYWLQEGKIGAGGKSQKITAGTFKSLKEAGVIKPVKREPGRFHGIYELDREVLAAMGQTLATDGA